MIDRPALSFAAVSALPSVVFQFTRRPAASIVRSNHLSATNPEFEAICAVGVARHIAMRDLEISVR